MIKLYDKVKIKKSGELGIVIDIDNNNNTRPDIYLVEIIDKPKNYNIEDVILWCDYEEVIKV